MAENDDTPTAPTGKLMQPEITFRSDSAHESRFASGRISCFEDVVLARVVILIDPDGPARPLRATVSFDDALQMSHSLIAAASRLHRASAG